MKTKLYAIIIALIISVQVKGQSTCGFTGGENQITDSLLMAVKENRNGFAYSLPIVFHVIHLGEPVGTGTNISEAQILSAVGNLNGASGLTDPQGTSAWGALWEMSFCMAAVDPFGNPSNGINRIDGRVVPKYGTEGINLGGASTPGALEMDIKNLSIWPRANYINVWIVSEIADNNGGAGVQGYAYFPTFSLQDGIVQLYNATGTVGNLKSYTNLNKTLVHEMGHYFNLYHTFQANSCSVDGDFCADTPNTTLNSNCGIRACGNQQVENYMDYTSEICKNTMTANQVARMQASLLLPTRSTLVGQTLCAGVQPPIAYFQQSDYYICTGDSVQLNAYNTNATGMSFSTGGNPAITANNNKWIVYNTEGTYNVRLIASNSAGSDTVYSNVNVTNCSASGRNNANWVFGVKGSVNFNPLSSVSPNSMAALNESCGAMSSSAGMLQYYTNGKTVYDNKHVVRATHLNGSPNQPSPSSTSATQLIILPISDTVSYIFTVSDVYLINSSLNYGLSYYKVSVNWNNFINGMPYLTVGTLQQPSVNYRTTEGITIVPACPSGWWIIVKAFDNLTSSDPNPKNKIIAYKFNGTTITGYQISNGWTYTAFPRGNNDGVGTHKANSTGRLIAFSDLARDTTYLYAFDKTSGALTPLTGVKGGYASCFAGDFLYTSNLWEVNRFPVHNLDLCNIYTPARDYTRLLTGGTVGQLQLAQDGRMYVMRSFRNTLSRFDNPTGVPIFIDNALQLSAGAYGLLGIQNQIDALAGQFPCADQCVPLALEDLKLSLNGELLTWIDKSENTAEKYELLYSLDLNTFEVIHVEYGLQNLRKYHVSKEGYYTIRKTTFRGGVIYSNFVYFSLNASSEKAMIYFDEAGRLIKNGKFYGKSSNGRDRLGFGSGY